MSALLRAVAAAALSLFSIPTSVTPAAARGEVVPFNGEASAGTIVVRTSERRLYLVLGEGRALSYPVGVGRAGRQWAGRSISTASTSSRPGRRRPTSRERVRAWRACIEGGSPSNPMGAAALTLSGGEYAIHGTNDPSSIGGFVSYGCIRMYNQDITDLYDRVSIGTPVLVTR